MECEFNSFFWSHSSGKICDTSVDKTFSVTTPNRVITSINGEPLKNFSKKRKIRRLLIEHKTVKFFPKGLGDAFPLLQGIRINNASLKVLTKDDLQPFGGLLELNLARNQIETLESDLFVFNQKLQSVNLDHNKIRIVGEFLLQPLLDLVEVDFRSNSCIDKTGVKTVKSSLKFVCKFPGELRESDLKKYLESREQAFQLKVRLLEVEIAALKSDNKTFLKNDEQVVKKPNDDYNDQLFCGNDCDNYEDLYSDEDEEPKVDLFEKCASLVKLKVEPRLEKPKTCKHVEEVKDNSLSEKLQEKMKALELQIGENGKLESKLLQVESEVKSCDDSFDAATRNWFMSLTELKSCRNPQSTAVITSRASEKLNLVCKADDDSDSYYDNVACRAVNFKVELSNSSIAQVLDENGESIGQNDIRRLSIIKQLTLFLPINLDDHFPSMHELIISSSGFFLLEAKAFEKLTGLTDLTITGNKIREVPLGVFTEMKILMILNLSHNRIEKLEDRAFEGLSKLIELKLNDNLLTTLKDNWFKGLTELKQLDLQSNQLKIIDGKFLASLTLLMTLNLTDNKCIDAAFPTQTREQIKSTIGEECVAPIELNCNFADDKIHLDENVLVNGYMCNVQEPHELDINFQNAKIAQLNGDHAEYYDKHNVTLLVVVDQCVKFLPNNLADFLPKLETIIIENSNLTTLEKQNFKGFDNLKWISIRLNNLSVIDGEAFDLVPLVTYIDLTYNNIKTLPSKIFSKLTKLQTLTLSNNKIKTLNADIFPIKNSILEFRVDSNQIELIDPKVLRYLRRSSVIDFTLNECIDMKFVRSNKDGTTFPELYTEVGLSCSEL